LSRWRFDHRPSSALPPLAWLARIEGTRVTVDCGAAVRCADDGFFEGSWAGAPALADVCAATTVFGSGMVVDDGQLLALTPSHNLEALYSTRRPDALLMANSLVALLAGAGLELAPGVDYPALFGRTREGIGRSPIELPTLGQPVRLDYFENLAITPGGELAQRAKPREAPFTSFADYRDRIRAALASIIANGAPRVPVVPLSSGYDSTAIAALAAPLGVTRAVGFTSARDFAAAGREADDSAAATAGRLGLELASGERLAYRRRGDLPEAEFLASGMTGEEVVFSTFEQQLRGTVLLTGTWPAWIWARHAPYEPNLERDDMSGTSMTEFRLRIDCVYVPLAFFGATAQPSLTAISEQPDMRPFQVGGRYDRPIPRRLAEEAGLPRGTFALRKLGVSATLHRRPREAFAPATLAAIDDFARRAGEPRPFGRRLQTGRLHRGLQRLATRLGARRLADALQRQRRARTHFGARDGNLVLRWAVSVVAPRYAALRSDPE
jgi:hypothetical protein